MLAIYEVSKETLENFKNHFRIEEGKEIEISMIVYRNGDVYVGQREGEKRNGLGTTYYITGEVHIGNWLNDIREGCGVNFKNTGVKYLGRWRNGKMNTKYGEIEFGVISYYKGEINNDEICGKGFMYYNEQEAYDGYWKKNQWHGQGVIKYKSGETYRGEFNEGERCGFGECIWPVSGLHYKGEWECDNFHGNGVLDAKEYHNKIHTGPWHYGVQQESGLTINYE